MSWNYRICKETKPIKDDSPETLGDGVVVYGIHEAYYNDDGEIWGVTDDPIGVFSSIFQTEDQTEEQCLKDMKLTIDWFLEAFEKDIIDLDTIEFAEHD